jgi:hypothetical protein
MNWNAVGAVGQILGSLATFVTVGYLVVQVHDTEAEIKRSIEETHAERAIEINLALATSERLAAIHWKGDAALILGEPKAPVVSISPEHLNGATSFFVAAINQLGFSPDEVLMLNSELSARWSNWAQTILYVDELPPGDHAQFDIALRIGLVEPVVRFWWDSNKSYFNPDAVRYVENVLSQPSSTLN